MRKASELNDPFELRNCFDINECNVKQYIDILARIEGLSLIFDAILDIRYCDEIKEVIKTIINESIALRNEEWGKASLRTDPKNILMWTHYAKEGSAICIEYNEDLIKELKLFPVDYVDHQNLTYKDFYQLLEESPDSVSFVIKLYATKSKVWEYENEIRGVRKQPNTSVQIAQNTIQSVIFCYNTSLKDKQEIIITLRHLEIDFKQASITKDQYSLDIVSLRIIK